MLLIDYQPPQISTVRSIYTGDLINNVVALARTARTFDLPIVLSTVNVTAGVNADTIPQLRDVLGDVPSIDRTAELRCYVRDPDGYLIEVGQAIGLLEGILADPPAGET